MAPMRIPYGMFAIFSTELGLLPHVDYPVKSTVGYMVKDFLYKA